MGYRPKHLETCFSQRNKLATLVVLFPSTELFASGTQENKNERSTMH
jgi:hypothetical protein